METKRCVHPTYFTLPVAVQSEPYLLHASRSGPKWTLMSAYFGIFWCLLAYFGRERDCVHPPPGGCPERAYAIKTKRCILPPSRWKQMFVVCVFQLREITSLMHGDLWWPWEAHPRDTIKVLHCRTWLDPSQDQSNQANLSLLRSTFHAIWCDYQMSHHPRPIQHISSIYLPKPKLLLALEQRDFRVFE